MAEASGSKPPKKEAKEAKPPRKNAKLTPLELKLYKIGLEQPEGTVDQKVLFARAGLQQDANTQDALNSLLRKSLVKLYRDSNGANLFKFVDRNEAKSMGEMDMDEKLVYDEIKEAGDRGIWTKTLKTRLGLHQTVLNRCLKSLEGKKQVKTVKSIKAPTRKMYMLASLTPSPELTGGPWYSDNELDLAFVEALKEVASRFLKQRGAGGKSGLLPVAMTPSLPTVSEVREFIEGVNITQVKLLDEHIEALLDLMVFDGVVDKILVTDLSLGSDFLNGKTKKRKRGGAASDDSDSDVPKRGAKGKAKGRAKKATKSKKKKAASDEDDMPESDAAESESESSDDFDEDEDAETARQRRGSKKTQRRKKKRRKRFVNSDEEGGADDVPTESEDDDDTDAEDRRRKRKEQAAQLERASGADYVYRLARSGDANPGLTDLPCGRCPVESFCTEARSMIGADGTPAAVKKQSVREGGMLGGVGKPKLTVDGSMPPSAARPPLSYGGLQGIGMLGGAGAAVGASSEAWGAAKETMGQGVAPVNPKNCVYLDDWLTF